MKNEDHNSHIDRPMSLYNPSHRVNGDIYAVSPLVGEEGYGNDSPPSTGGSTLQEYVRAIKSRKWLILGMVAVGCLCGVAVAIVQQVNYTAFTTLEIHGLNENFMNLGEVDAQANSGAYSATTSNIHTQIKILESLNMRERVLKRLKLETLPPPPSRGTLVQRIRIALRLSSENTVEDAQAALKMATLSTRAAAIRDTRIIEVRCRSTSPEIAALYLNTLVNEYIEQTMEVRSLSARRTSEWLVNQLAETRERLQQLDGKLRDFERTTGYTATSPEATLAGTKSRQLQTELAAVQAERIAKQSKWDLARTSSPASLPDVIDDTALRARQSQILDLRKQIADVTTVLTPAHYQVKRLMAQLAQVESEADADRKRVLDRIRGEYEAALRRERMLGGAYSSERQALSGESEKATQHSMLVREREVALQMHNSMLQQVSQASMAAAVLGSQVRAIDQAKPLYETASAGPIAGILMGGFAGLLLGIVFSVVKEAANRTVRTPRVATELINVPQLAVVPSVESATLFEKTMNALPANKPLALAAAASSTAEKSGIGTQATNFWGSTPTVIAEAFRVAHTSLVISNERRRCQLLVVTSPAPEEGKTFSTSHLGRAAAEAGRRTLLVDLDLRRPSLHKQFDLKNTHGIADLIRRDAPTDAAAWRDAIRPSGLPGLSILPAGKVGIADILSMLYSPKLARLLDQFRSEYDFVLLDTVPMLAVSEARAIGRLSDGVLLVLRAGVTQKESAAEARNRLVQDGTRIIGTFLNDVPITTDNNYYLYGYKYHTQGG